MYDLDELTRYVLDTKAQLGLSDWSVRCEEAEPSAGDDPNLVARTTIQPGGYREAVISFYPNMKEQDADELRHTILHELLHIHVDKLIRHARWIEDHMNPPTYHLWMMGVHESKEEVTDSLAYAIMEFFPLPKIKEETADSGFTTGPGTP